MKAHFIRRFFWVLCPLFLAPGLSFSAPFARNSAEERTSFYEYTGGSISVPLTNTFSVSVASPSKLEPDTGNDPALDLE